MIDPKMLKANEWSFNIVNINKQLIDKCTIIFILHELIYSNLQVLKYSVY